MLEKQIAKTKNRTAEDINGDLEYLDSIKDELTAEEISEMAGSLRQELQFAEEIQAETSKYQRFSKVRKGSGASAISGEMIEDTERRLTINPETGAANYHVGPRSIKWLENAVDVEMSRHGSGETAFWYGNIIDKSPQTGIGNRYTAAQLSMAERQVRTHIEQRIAAPYAENSLDLLKDKLTQQNTELTALKDRGVTAGGKHNDARALVLRDLTAGESPVYLLASISSHGQQEDFVYQLGPAAKQPQ